MKIIQRKKINLDLFNKSGGIIIKCKIEDFNYISNILINNGFINDEKWNNSIMKNVIKNGDLYIRVYRHKIFSVFINSLFVQYYTIDEILI